MCGAARSRSGLIAPDSAVDQNPFSHERLSLLRQQQEIFDTLSARCWSLASTTRIYWTLTRYGVFDYSSKTFRRTTISY